MVATIDEILQTVRSNPFIDGIGYFIEVTTHKPVTQEGMDGLQEQMQQHFCAHSQLTLEGTHVLGLDFHEHILTRGEEGDEGMWALEQLLKRVEMQYGIDHLCIEFQFDFRSARKTSVEVDELLRP